MQRSSNLQIVGRVNLVDGEFDIHDLDFYSCMIEIPATTALLTTHCPRIEEGMYDLNRLLAITIEGVLSTMMFSKEKG